MIVPQRRPMMEFHVAREARDFYQFDEWLFAISGNVVLANFHASRVFAQRMNDKRDLANFPERAVRASEINAMGLIDEMLHHIIETYRQQHNPHIMRDALEWLNQQIGPDEVERVLRRFGQEFPPLTVYRREQDLERYIEDTTAGVPNRELMLEELLMLWLSNANPAYSPYLELFDDEGLEHHTPYPPLIEGLQSFFESQPGFGPSGENLIRVLRAPALASPHSLTAQLEFMLGRYGGELGRFFYRMLGSLDLIKEEERALFLAFGGGGAGDGGGQAEVFTFGHLEVEPENFTPDREWMPRLVLMAKNAFVWLDQLSRRYDRPIETLADIPDEELDLLQRAGVTGLWLIGLWERSEASKNVKQMMGNPEAVASAYSLFDYDIARDLGGDRALQVLREKAWQRGIRLASDMVPNHMGVDSRWVVQHPEWFVQSPYPPYPAYTFNGPDLSWDESVGIFLEDHYYDRTDAAVVFKRLDRRTGEERFIYHGNDGTSMPWNDTAQLNYLKAEVREAVIQTILHVARNFPIIRFDAAMTLAKRHYQRLWFPQPGSGGDHIPSRGDYALTKEQFDELMPVEFWREVVDRAAIEAPDTLLLAEAFWLMEGYFVRSLGMHRVYNSAFMNMMRDERNAEYRKLIKNTLEFDPEILKRYVNFMNNPDERTAVDQYGKGDKYFGVATLLATLPGLPMLGHGQIEGFAEKYGMEYRRAYWDEQPDQYLIARHEREIFPLLHRRHIFADADNFLLYDVSDAGGGVNENVFAYSNMHGDERALVVYNNAFANTSGWIRLSSPVSMRMDNGERTLVQRTLGEGLRLTGDHSVFYIFHDQSCGLEFIRRGSELVDAGFYIELGAYSYHVFLEFREVRDTDGRYAAMASYLNGRGVPSVEGAMRELALQPVHQPFRAAINAKTLRALIDLGTTVKNADIPADDAEPEEDVDLTEDTDLAEQPETEAQLDLEQIEAQLTTMYASLRDFAGSSADPAELAAATLDDVRAVLRLPQLAPQAAISEEAVSDEEGDQELAEPDLLTKLLADLGTKPSRWGTLLGWALTRRLGALQGRQQIAQISRSLLDEWLLGQVLASELQALEMSEGDAWRSVAAIKLLLSHEGWCESVDITGKLTASSVLTELLRDHELQTFIGVNRSRNVLWFNKESFEQLLWLLGAQAAVQLGAEPETAPSTTQPGVDLPASIIGGGAALGFDEIPDVQTDNLAASIIADLPSATPSAAPSATKPGVDLPASVIAATGPESPTIDRCLTLLDQLRSAQEHAEYQLEKLIEAARK